MHVSANETPFTIKQEPVETFTNTALFKKEILTPKANCDTEFCTKASAKSQVLNAGRAKTKIWIKNRLLVSALSHEAGEKKRIFQPETAKSAATEELTGHHTSQKYRVQY